MLHLSPLCGNKPRILFLPNWRVHPEVPGEARQSPDFFPRDGRYWMFRHFDSVPRVDVLDAASWRYWAKEEQYLRFYVGQAARALSRCRDYDLVFAFGAQSAVALLGALRLLRRRHPPVIVDDAGCLNAGRPDRRLSFWSTRWALREAAHVVWHSSASLRLCEDVCPELATRGQFFPFGVNLPDLAGAVVADGDYAICVGQSPRDWRNLAATWSRFPYRQLILVGAPQTGVPRQPNVTVLPKVPFAEYISLLAGARLVILPIPDGLASWGQMTLLQAMGLGKPVIVTDVRPVRDYISAGCVRVKANDVADLTRAVDRFWEDEEARRTLGNEARRVIADFYSEPVMAKRFQSIITETLLRAR